MPLHAPVAVVGMACRLPGAPDLASYARLLREGRDAVGPIPEGRWNLDALRAFAGGEIPDAVLRGGWLPRVRDLDAAFARTSTPAPYDILNQADAQNLGHAHWAMAIFGLLPMEEVPYGHFPYGHVAEPGRVVLRESVHEEHFKLFVDTRPAGWAPTSEIIR